MKLDFSLEQLYFYFSSLALPVYQLLGNLPIGKILTPTPRIEDRTGGGKLCRGAARFYDMAYVKVMKILLPSMPPKV